MDGVVSGVFLILESGLRNDGKRKAKAGGESSGVKSGTSLTRTSSPTPPASAGVPPAPAAWGHIREPRAVGPGVGRNHSEGCLGRGVGSHIQGRWRGRQDRPGPLTRLSLGNTCQFPGNWKRPWRFFSSEFLALHCRLPVIFAFL